MNIIIKCLMILAIMVIIPMTFGDNLCQLAKWEDSLASKYIIGNIFLWAIFQLLSVPMIYLKMPFHNLLYTYSLVIIVLFILSLVWLIIFYKRNNEKKISLKKRVYNLFKASSGLRKIMMWILSLIMIISIAFQISQYVFLAHRDNDDSRFVVNACDAYEQDAMYTINYKSGEPEENITVERDLTSPWSMYVAWQAKVVHIYPTILFHTVLPIFLILMGYSVIWMLGYKYFKRDIFYTIIFTMSVSIINNFFNLSVYTSSTFFLVRIWQGKAIVAGIMIPLLMYLYYRIYRHNDEIITYFILFITNISMCLLSGAGILLSPIMNVSYGISYAFSKKKMSIFFGMLLACVPSVFYGVIYIVYRR